MNAFTTMFSRKPNPVAPTNAANNQQQQAQPQGNPSTGSLPPTGGQPNPQGPGTMPNGGNNNPNAGSNEPVNPMDAYGKMFDNVSSEGDAPPSFSIDDEVLSNVAGQQDFMKGVDPALMERATSGDVKAMMEMMQAVSRNAYKASLQHGSLLTDKFVGARETHNDKSFGKRVKGELTQAELANTHNFNHPVVRTQLTEIAQKLQKQHPDAPPSEIAKMSRQYLTDLVAAINPADPTKTPQAQADAKTTDWEAYFSEDASTEE